MAHWSENATPLMVRSSAISEYERPHDSLLREPAVWLIWLPHEVMPSGYTAIRQLSSALHSESILCILTTPSQAARILPCLEATLKFQLWVSVKTQMVCPDALTRLPSRHAALLVMSRYRGSLKHTKTRIAYTYCPACGRTTKDYGGKKHVYHEYGTLISDVWRDIEIDLSSCTGIQPVVHRLSDLFGLPPYRTLHLLEWTGQATPHRDSVLARETLFTDYAPASLPPESQLIQGDCIEALRRLPDCSVDFCFADPPYNLRKKYDHWNDDVDSREYFKWCDQWLAELARVLKPGRTLAVLNIPLWAVRHYQFLETQLQFQNWIVWEALSFPVRMIMPAHYTILCFSKGEPRPLPAYANSAERDFLEPLSEGFCLRPRCQMYRRLKGIPDRDTLTDLWYDIHRLKHNSRRLDHPCQLPPTLMYRLIATFTYPGEVVVDCFNGIGTTTLAAQQMGRRFIGIELSERYHSIAMQRHQILSEGGDPFAKHRETPEAKNSPVPRLRKQKYLVSKKTLQLEVKRIAQALGRIPTRQEVAQMSKYPLELYDQYFLSWGEVCAAARTTGMSELPPNSRLPQQLSLLSEEALQ
ncbi:MAG: site-specific DNA-methyltransferase [Fimbriimonadales bacterium]|nr:site-specific DNA-methyltransferase [Fimbriimonadales bacterium]